MKPFNLEQALNGAKLVTREGKEAKQFRSLDNAAGNMFRYTALVDNAPLVFTKNGRRYLNDESSSVNDLFLADEETPSMPVHGPSMTELFSEVLPEPTILEEAQNLIYGDREESYGSVTKNFNNIAQGWSVILGKEVTPEQVGLMMAWLKIARYSYKPKRDSLVDVAGYIGCIDKIGKGL